MKKILNAILMFFLRFLVLPAFLFVFDVIAHFSKTTNDVENSNKEDDGFVPKP